MLDYPFGLEPTVFKVMGKVFATIYRKGETTRFGLKCDPILADFLCQQYESLTMMDRSIHWIYVFQGGDVPSEEVLNLIDLSYSLVVKGLPKNKREFLQAENSRSPVMMAEDVVGVIALLEQHDIEVYVDGGWGVDALLGRQTRKHEDLDIALPHKYVPQLRELLCAVGYKDMPWDNTRDCNFVMGDDQWRLVDVHTFTFDENGNNIYGVAYEPQHLVGTGSINGYPVKCPPPEVMVEFHTGYDVDEDDYHDVKLLCEQFDISLPKEYERFEI